MSYFDDASLAFLPSGAAGKDGKAYSIKPTDGTGDFTFSRGSNLAATRVGPGPDYFIEKGRENLLLQSNQFDTTWATAATSVTSNQAGYDGFNDAWKLETTSNGSRYLQQSISVNSVQSISIYAKSGTTDFLAFNIVGGGGGYSFFNLSNGTLGSSSSVVIDKNIELVSGTTDWYRCSFVINGNINTVRIYPTNADNNFASTTGQNIYIQDSQAEIGLAATEYIESGATKGTAGILENTPRFDYSNGASCPSLLLEPSRTNVIGQSEYLSGYALTNTSIETNATTSPEGLENATKLIEDTSTGEHRILNSAVLTSSGVAYTYSFFVKANGRNKLRFYAYAYNNLTAIFDFAANNVISITGGISPNITSESYGSGWYRVKITSGTIATNIGLNIMLVKDDNSFAYTGNGTSGVFLYGFQIEAGSYVSSYIPNHSGGTITRAAEINNLSSLPNTLSDNYSVFIEINRITNSSKNNEDFMNLGSASSDRIRLMAYGVGRVRFRLYYNDGTNASFFTNINDWDKGDTIKFCITYSNGTILIYANGVLLHTISQTLNNLNSFNMESQKVNKSLLFNTTLTPSEAITLTTI